MLQCCMQSSHILWHKQKCQIMAHEPLPPVMAEEMTKEIQTNECQQTIFVKLAFVYRRQIFFIEYILIDSS